MAVQARGAGGATGVTALIGAMQRNSDVLLAAEAG